MISCQKKVGKENIDKVAELYNDAYAGTGMTAEEIWEECICDSLGEMNIFADEKISGKLLKKALPKISKATKQNKIPTQTRGSPDGKASRETKRKTKIRNTVKYLSSNKVGASNMEYIRSNLRNLYRGVSDGIADGIAIGDGNTVYIVDSGRENGKIDFGIRFKITINNESLRADYIKERNDYAISNGKVSDGLSQRLGNGLGYDRDSDLRRESGTELQADKGESKDKQGRIRGENANQRGLTKNKASRELDTTYLDAVNRGDMEAAQKIVDEAVNEAGYTIKAHHEQMPTSLHSTLARKMDGWAKESKNQVGVQEKRRGKIGA